MVITVAQDGSGDCRSIREAIDIAPAGTHELRTVIQIRDGVYREKLHIEKPFLHLKGESAERTIIVYGDYARKTFPDGTPYHTFHSYTVLFGADDLTVEDMTIRNDAGRGEAVGQALAAYVDGDRALFRNCRFIGHQDTLFTGPLPEEPLSRSRFGGPREGVPRRPSRQWYDRCYIEGDVDFIFGSATAVFTDCEIFSRNRLTVENRPMIESHSGINGWITAASTPVTSRFGYVFIGCRLTGDAPDGTVYLGRPWRNHAKVAWIGCRMGAHIRAEGWDNWGKPESEETVSYVEYGCTGPGSEREGRVSWSGTLTEEQARDYDPVRIFAGDIPWIPFRETEPRREEA